MRKAVKKLLTLTLAVLLVFSCTGCNLFNKDKPLSQWDYFSEYVGYSLYTTDPEHKDYEEWEGWGVIKDTVINHNYSIRNNDIVFTNEDISETLLKQFYSFSIRPTEKVDQIVLKSFSVDIASLTTQKLSFKVKIGDRNIGTYETNVVAGQLTTMNFHFAEQKWDTGSKLGINFYLQDCNLVKPYIFLNLKMNIARR